MSASSGWSERLQSIRRKSFARPLKMVAVAGATMKRRKLFRKPQVFGQVFLEARISCSHATACCITGIPRSR